MNLELLRASLERAVKLDFARSSGPGGQNVNKTNSKVVARAAVEDLDGLSESEKDRVRQRLASRLTEGGELVVHAREERSQLANRRAALARLEALIVQAARRPKARRPTLPTAAGRERRLAGKRVRSRVKQARGRPATDS